MDYETRLEPTRFGKLLIVNLNYQSYYIHLHIEVLENKAI